MMIIILLSLRFWVFVHSSDILGNESFPTLPATAGLLIVSHVLLEAAYRIRELSSTFCILLALISCYFEFLLQDLLGRLVLPTWEDSVHRYREMIVKTFEVDVVKIFLVATI